MANTLQVYLDSGAKKVLLPIVLAVDSSKVSPPSVVVFNLIFFNNIGDAVFKVLGVEQEIIC